MKCLLYCGCKWKWRVIIAVNFQFKQLEGRSLKNIRASTGYKPVTSAIPVRCSVHTLRTRSICWVHVFPCTEMMWNICMKCTLYCGCRWKWRVIIAVNFKFKQLEGRSWKISALIFFRLVPFNCLNWTEIYCDDHSSLWNNIVSNYETTELTFPHCEAK